MRKKKHEHVNHERWLVSYADFITLLFAFFVVMYAISQADMAKMKKVSESMQKAFGSSPNAGGSISLSGSSGGESVQILDPFQDSGGRIQNMPSGRINTEADKNPEIQSLKEKLEETISLEAGSNDPDYAIQWVYDSDGLVLRLAVTDIFDAGKTEVAPDLRPLLDRIGKVLSTTQNLFRVEGHTDPAEEKDLSSGPYKTAWELSAARAAWVADRWIQKYGISPTQVGVAGYGHFRPRTKADGEAKKGSNRRIEIIISNNRLSARES